MGDDVTDGPVRVAVVARVTHSSGVSERTRLVTSYQPPLRLDLRGVRVLGDRSTADAGRRSSRRDELALERAGRRPPSRAAHPSSAARSGSRAGRARGTAPRSRGSRRSSNTRRPRRPARPLRTARRACRSAASLGCACLERPAVEGHDQLDVSPGRASPSAPRGRSFGSARVPEPHGRGWSTAHRPRSADPTMAQRRLTAASPRPD